MLGQPLPKPELAFRLVVPPLGSSDHFYTVSLLSLHCCGAEVLYLSNPKAEIMSDAS